MSLQRDFVRLCVTLSIVAMTVQTRPVTGASPAAAPLQGVGFGLPFGLGNLGGGDVQVNMPFNQVRLPGTGPLANRLFVKLNGPKQGNLATKPGGDGTPTLRCPANLKRSFLPPGASPGLGLSPSQAAAAAGAGQSPVSVINMPFYEFQMPLSNVRSDGSRNELPQALRQRINRERQIDAALGDPVARALVTGQDVLQAAQPQARQLLNGAGQDASIGLSERALKGNLDTSKQFFGSKKGHPDLPAPNKLSLPMSVLNFPLHLMDMPLSKMMLPFSRLNALPQFFGQGGVTTSVFPNAALPQASPLDAVLAAGSAQSLGAGAPALGKKRRRKRSESGCHPEDHLVQVQRDIGATFPSTQVCRAAEALTPDLPFNLNSFSLPYSFINNPLGFFNLPLAYINLPYGSFNMPIGHLNLPFGFNNLPFFEMMQTFGVPPVLRSADTEVPLVHPNKVDVVEEEVSPLSGHELVPSDCFYEEPEVPVNESAQAAVAADSAVLTELLDSIEKARLASDKSDLEVKQPSDVVGLTDSLIAGAVSAGVKKKAGADDMEVRQELRSATDSLNRFSASVPELGGLFGTPNALFTTPFSLFNLPIGFLDEPLAFMNMPFSHFNLPLAHMTLPFNGFALPTFDIVEPEIHQTVETATVELADIPPSLLELLNPEDVLKTYVNMPMSELNLPLAILDMPFTVFDLPFAFMNLPMSHFNNPFTNLHLPFEISSLPLADLALPFAAFMQY